MPSGRAYATVMDAVGRILGTLIGTFLGTFLGTLFGVLSLRELVHRRRSRRSRRGVRPAQVVGGDGGMSSRDESYMEGAPPWGDGYDRDERRRTFAGSFASSFGGGGATTAVNVTASRRPPPSGAPPPPTSPRARASRCASRTADSRLGRSCERAALARRGVPRAIRTRRMPFRESGERREPASRAPPPTAPSAARVPMVERSERRKTARSTSAPSQRETLGADARICARTSRPFVAPARYPRRTGSEGSTVTEVTSAHPRRATARTARHPRHPRHANPRHHHPAEIGAPSSRNLAVTSAPPRRDRSPCLPHPAKLQTPDAGRLRVTNLSMNGTLNLTRASVNTDLTASYNMDDEGIKLLSESRREFKLTETGFRASSHRNSNHARTSGAASHARDPSQHPRASGEGELHHNCSARDVVVLGALGAALAAW